MAAWAQFNAHNRSEFTATDQSGFSNQDNFSLTEQTGDAYAMASYTLDRLRLIGGVHYDTADIAAKGRAKVNGVWTDMPSSSGYHFFLPSFLATYQITGDVDARFGVSQTIGRPSYDSYVARSSINFVNAGDYGNPNATGVTVSIGNPSIKPRLSTNLDLGFDWRLDIKNGGLISVAFFNKDIQDEIFNSGTQGYTYQGVTYANAIVTRPINASSAFVRGVEASATVNSLEFLHPLLESVGFNLNYSLMKGGMNVLQSSGAVRKLPGLVGQPNYIFNAALFYSVDGFEARIAYNKQGSGVRSIVPDTAWQDMYWAPRDQVDAQISYEFLPGFTAFGQLSNITQSRITSMVGPNHGYLKDTYSVPSVLWAGLRFTPSL